MMLFNVALGRMTFDQLRGIWAVISTNISRCALYTCQFCQNRVSCPSDNAFAIGAKWAAISASSVCAANASAQYKSKEIMAVAVVGLTNFAGR